ncbi:hypothetical protein GQF61_11530 [Sphingobacterium sp. DK4209]|uniref:Glycoside hydrolase family 28 protein n=1 Tax=Sphingobacterium zhuxiongii TaxID=2662364 RepID=A0A5Q0QEY5_9SPHI|nr:MULTISPECIES: hypothetical protein [unclassified Sphingobacterium]MVZ66491.1 hypothetical protein [Sphingobacterium sp. DK4209]QGA27854.1 hypothetical protein GFH32_16660 [Sphingobacterium sp. dk4302]
MKISMVIVELLRKLKKNSALWLVCFLVPCSILVSSFAGAGQVVSTSTSKLKVNIDDFKGSDINKINEAIQFVSRSKGGVVEITRDVLIDQAIIMYSDVELHFSGKIKMKDGVFDNMIRIGGVIVDAKNPNGVCADLKETRNIKILGIGEQASLEGSDIAFLGLNPKTGKQESFIGDFYGWRTITILLSNVKGFEIGNFAISKTKCWAISHEWGCQDGYLHDLKFSTAGIKNGDGINLRNGCKDILIENIEGQTGDDTIACTALNASVMEGKRGENYVWPMQTMGYEYKGKAEAGIENIRINNIAATSDHNNVRLLTTSPNIHNISITNVKGNANINVVLIHTGYGNGFNLGNFKNIKIEGVSNESDSKTLNCEAPILAGQIKNIQGQVFINPESKDIKFSK